MTRLGNKRGFALPVAGLPHAATLAVGAPVPPSRAVELARHHRALGFHDLAQHRHTVKMVYASSLIAWMIILLSRVHTRPSASNFSPV